MRESSRERVLATMNHREPKHVAVDFGGHRSSGIMALAYRKLRRYLELPERLPRVYDMVQQLAIVDDDVLDRFGVDTVELGRAFSNDDTDWQEWHLPDGSPCLIPAWVDVRRMGDDWFLYGPSGKQLGVQRSGMLYFDQVYWPFADGVPGDLSSLPEFMANNMWAVPGPPGPSIDTQALAAGARALRTQTDRAILGLFGGNLMEWGQFLCRNDNFFCMLAAEPQTAHRLLDHLTEIHLSSLERYLAAVGPYIDIILFGDDLGMQSGPQISPAMYREFFQPRHALLWRRAKELADVKVMLHSCGGIAPLLDDLIAAGLDAVNPVQTSCTGMDPQTLKKHFGQRICLWGGGCDTRTILPQASQAEVKRHVHERLRVFAPDGGFVFQQVHNIMADVPSANIVAMFDAVGDYREDV